MGCGWRSVGWVDERGMVDRRMSGGWVGEGGGMGGWVAERGMGG